MTSSELNRQFALANMLHFETSPGGLVRARITTPLAEAVVYSQGAHLAEWAPRGQKPVLFLSSKSQFAKGKAIRGGVPIIFPWFGPRWGNQPGPAHGFARTLSWTVENTRALATGEVEISFLLDSNDASPSYGFDALAARFTATLGAELAMSFDVVNRGGAEIRFEDALHTYIAVSDIRDVAVQGLEGTEYIDKTDNLARKRQPEAPIRIAKETDQVHVNTNAACVIADEAWSRRITIRKTGSGSTVVWNPWIAKTASMADMEPNEWTSMICVESANVGENAVTLAPGDTHRMTATISVE